MFTAAKIIDSVIRPDHLLLIVATLGFLRMLLRAVRPGRFLIGAAVLAGWTIAITPVPGLMLRTLEERVPVPSTVPASPHGLILLGGMILPDVSENLGEPVFGAAASRMTGFLPLVRTYPDAAILFTGANDAPYARQYFLSVGVVPERLLIEDQARTTRENAIYSYALATPDPGEDWILVTSAHHMPRALAIYRKIGWDVVPYPVGRATPPGAIPWRFDLIGGLMDTRAAVHEYLGLALYWWRGDIGSIWPHP